MSNPPNLNYCTITGNFKAFVADSGDSDDLPDFPAVTGTGEIWPNVEIAKNIEDGYKSTYFNTPTQVYLDEDGDLSQGGRKYVIVLASSPYITPQGFTYSIRLTVQVPGGGSRSYGPYAFNVEPGGEVNISDVIPVSASAGVPIIQGVPGPRGDIGPMGPQGLIGPEGPIGLTGQQGEQGIQGIQGNDGLTGPEGPQGGNGPQGEAGPQGEVGETGPQGPQGDVGPQGDPGTAGADGTSVTIKGSVATATSLPPTGNSNGDGWVTSNDGHLHVWNGTSFNDVGTVKGPKGDQGIQGIQGIVGPQGAIGPQGANGPAGIQGPIGNTGLQGAKGDTGVAGPAGAVGSTGAAGPQGAVGPAGAIGPRGLQGIQGADGADGIAASVSVTGTTTGAAGSLAAVTQGGTATARTLAFTIPRGTTGATGPQGPSGPIGATGAKGADGADATTTLVAITTGTDLDNITTAGSYQQGSNASATAVLHYPIDGVCGKLIVSSGLVGSTFIYQEFEAYANAGSGHSGKIFRRSKYSSSAWTAWEQVIRDKDVATSTTNGAMSAADKVKLDGATSGSGTASALVSRASNGFFAVPDPISATHPATKAYVDAPYNTLGDIVRTNYITNTNSGTTTGYGTAQGSGTGALSWQDFTLSNGKKGWVRYTQNTTATSTSGINTGSTSLAPITIAIGDSVVTSATVRTNKTGVTNLRVVINYRNGTTATKQKATTIHYTLTANAWKDISASMPPATETADNVYMSFYISGDNGGTYMPAGTYLDLANHQLERGQAIHKYFDATLPLTGPDADLYSVVYAGTTGNSRSVMYAKANTATRESNGNIYATDPELNQSVANKLYVDREVNATKAHKQDSLIIGWNRSNSEAGYTGAKQFDQIYELEELFQTTSDTASYYHPVNQNTAYEYSIEVVPELNRNPNRKIMWAMELHYLNDEFNKEFDAEGEIYWRLRDTFKAIIDGGNMDRLYLAPMHECNGPGGAYPWQMNDMNLFFYDNVTDPEDPKWISATSTAATATNPVTMKGTKANFASLPTSGNSNGDAWYIATTGSLYLYRGSSFTSVGVPSHNDPAKYIKAYKKIVDLAREMGMTAKFIQWFLINNSDSDNSTVDQEAIEVGFVGDDYVDIIGLSYYNRYEKDHNPAYGSTWVNPGTDIRRFAYRIGQYSKRPLWTCETGCYDSDYLSTNRPAADLDPLLNKGQWYVDIINLMASGDIPNWQGCIMFLQTPAYTNEPQAERHDYYPETNEQGRMIGRAMNNARNGGIPFARSRHNRNLLGPAVSIPRSTSGWICSNSNGTFYIVDEELPRWMDKGSTALHIAKISTSTSDNAAYSFYRETDAFHDWEKQRPYTLSFTARASSEKFQLGAGVQRMSGSSPEWVGEDGIQLQTQWADYTVTIGNKSSDGTGWRMPVFRLGGNKTSGWAEITDIKLERGFYATPNTAKTVTPKVKFGTIPSTADWGWDCNNGDIWQMTISGNRTLPIPQGLPYDGQEITLRVKQDGTGSRVLTQSSSFRSSSVSSALQTGANTMNVLTYQYDVTAGKWGLIRNVAWGA